ncbi:MAG: NRDE family protein, partial [Bacteroidota bacterium]
MCTVTYIPNRSGFTLTHNRDEAPSRSSVSISQNDEGPDGQIVYPRDSKAGGTWFAVSESGKTVCLLNGAFVRHHHNPPYKRSRGLMVLDFFNYDDPDRFF